MGMKDLADMIGGNIAESQSMQSNLVKPGSNITQFMVNNYRIRIISSKFQLERRSAGDSFILGSPTNDILGTNKLGTVNAGTWGTLETQTGIQNITTSGREVLRDFFVSSANPAKYFALGIGTITYSIDQTALGSQTQSFSSNLFSSDTSNSKQSIIKYTSYPGQLTENSFNEMGWFTTTSRGKMFSRRLFNSTLDTTGTYWFRFNETFDIQDLSVGDSIIVDSGLNLVRDWLGDVSNIRPDYSGFGIGTGTITTTRITSLVAEQDRNSVSIFQASGFKARLTSVLSLTEPLNAAGTSLSVKLYQTGLMTDSIGNAPYLLDACDVTTGWGTSTDSSVLGTNTITIIEGSRSISLGKAGTATTTSYADKTIASPLNSTGGTFGYCVFNVQGKSDLATGTAVEIRLGSDNSNYYYKQYSNNELFNGWNTFEADISNLGSVGSPDISAIDYLYFGFNTDNAGTTIASGNVKMDYWHMINNGSATLFAATRGSPISKTNLFSVTKEDYIETV